MPRKPRFRNTGAGRGIKDALNRDLLHELYCVQRLTQAQIAASYDCSPQFISQLLSEYGLSRSPTGGSKPSVQ